MSTISHTMDKIFPERVTRRLLDFNPDKAWTVAELTRQRGRADTDLERMNILAELTALQRKGRAEYAGDGRWRTPPPPPSHDGDKDPVTGMR